MRGSGWRQGAERSSGVLGASYTRNGWVPLNAYVEILFSNVVALRGGVVGR